MKYVLGIIIFSICLSVQAAEVAKGEIVEIVNLIDNGKKFAVMMSSASTGPCAGKWVEFREENFGGNIESYKFAFSLATAALIAGKTVRVHNYSGDTCDGVTFIGLYK